MKRLFLLAICCMMGLANIHAQEPKLSAEALSFRSQIENYLKTEGYVPTIDTSDNTVNFKKEGLAYWLSVEDGDPFYIEVHEEGFRMEDDRLGMLEACNHANATIRCGKAFVNDTSVMFTTEFYCKTIDDFKKLFYDYLDVVNGVRDKTAEYYNERHKE